MRGRSLAGTLSPGFPQAQAGEGLDGVPRGRPCGSPPGKDRALSTHVSFLATGPSPNSPLGVSPLGFLEPARWEEARRVLGQ